MLRALLIELVVNRSIDYQRKLVSLFVNRVFLYKNRCVQVVFNILDNNEKEVIRESWYQSLNRSVHQQTQRLLHIYADELLIGIQLDINEKLKG